jgi:transcription initiation factor TFIIH subunit 2
MGISFWLLFPVTKYGVVTVESLQQSTLSPDCFGCDTEMTPEARLPVPDGVSPTGRYRCPKCSNDFCGNCDLYIHDTLHTCPGCSQ